MAQRVYVIEDESDIAELIKYNLVSDGFDVQIFESGEVGLKNVEKDKPELLILDLMLPGVGGFEICKKLKNKAKTQNIPIMMVTAKGEEEDIVKGLEAGADDYIAKPFSPNILKARAKAILRRTSIEKSNNDSDVLERYGLSIHLGRHEVKVNGELIDLTHSEFQILLLLAKRPGWVFTRSQIVDAIHGDNYAVTDRSIDFQMVGLRKKLGPMGEFLETVRGVGYRFRDGVDDAR